MYYRAPRSPDSHDRELIERTTHLARVAIERDFAEEALRTSEAKYRDLINASPDAISLIDADGRIVLINPAGVKLAGRPEHDDLRVQHPEWVEPNGDCPTCESYERRLAESIAIFQSEKRPLATV